jgi:adenylate kinase family enzyme
MTDFLVHLVCGSGAGKTTYAEALSKRIGGVRFSIDLNARQTLPFK